MYMFSLVQKMFFSYNETDFKAIEDPGVNWLGWEDSVLLGKLLCKALMELTDPLQHELQFLSGR